MQPFQYQQRKIPTLKPTTRSSPKIVDHISQTSCIAIPEEFAVSHRSNLPPRPANGVKKPTARPSHVGSNKPHFSARKSSLQQSQSQGQSQNQNITDTSSSSTASSPSISTPPSRSLPTVPQQASHSRFPSALIPVEIKEEINSDKDWAMNLLNASFNI